MIVHQAPGFVAAADAWCAELARSPHGLATWTRAAPSGEGIAVTGLAAAHLPDLWIRGAAVPIELEAAARALVALGQLPLVGASLGRYRVASADHAWIQLEAR